MELEWVGRDTITYSTVVKVLGVVGIFTHVSNQKCKILNTLGVWSVKKR